MTDNGNGGNGIKVTPKQQKFVDEFLICRNATEAARRAGYKQPNMAGPRMILKDSIRAYVNTLMDENSMKSNEIIDRYTSQARGSLGDFIDITNFGFSLNLQKAKELDMLHLIKKIKDRVVMTSDKDGNETETHHIEIELYDAQKALADLGKIRGLFITRHEVTWRAEIVELLQAGKIEPDDVVSELGNDLASELFVTAGIPVASDSAA